MREWERGDGGGEVRQSLMCAASALAFAAPGTCQAEDDVSAAAGRRDGDGLG